MDSEADIAPSTVPKNLLKVCRLCLNEKYLKDVFKQDELSQWISEYLSIEVSASDEVSKLICVICSARLKEFRKFQQSCLEVQDILHKELSKKRNTRCDVCQTSSETPRKLSDHMRQVHGPKKFACSFCDKSFSRPSRLKAHLAFYTAAEHSAVPQRQLAFQFSCEICSAVFESQESLKEHSSLHKLREELRIYGRARQESVQEATTKNPRDVFSPEAEGMEINDESTYELNNQPENFSNNIFATNAEPEEVSLCVKNEHQTISEEHSEFTIDQDLLEDPSLRVQPTKVVEASGKLKKSNGSVVCEQCDKVFDLKKKLWDHRRMVHGPRRHKCQYCDKAFVTRRDLEKHTEVHQRKLRNQFGCTICSAIFQSKESLKEHSRFHKLRREVRTYGRARQEPTQKATTKTPRDISSSEAERLEIYNESTENLDCASHGKNKDIEYLQPAMSTSAGKSVIRISGKDERQSSVGKPIKKVACTICNQLINPSLNTLRAHLKTHGVVDAEESSGEIIHVEEIKFEPFTIDDD